MPPTAGWALEYAKAGWRVFPARPGDKRPAYDNWQKDATTDPELIGRYWAPSLDRNIAVICGEHFDAWDIERAHLPLLEAWMVEHKVAFPDTPIASTGRGGIHVLTEPTGVHGNRYLYLNGVHIGELKSAGGFIILAPSKTVDYYRWLTVTPALAVAPLPEDHWLRGLLERPRSGIARLPTRVATAEDAVAVLRGLAHAVTAAGEGRRNNYLYWAMRRALEEGVPVAQAMHVLTAAAEEAGLDARETEQTIESAVAAESAGETVAA